MGLASHAGVASRLDLVALSLLWTERGRPAGPSAAGASGRGLRPGALAAGPVGARRTSTRRWRGWASSDRPAAARRCGRAPRARWPTREARGLGHRSRAASRTTRALLERSRTRRRSSGRAAESVPPSCAVAIVGSRAATPHGLEVGFRLGRDLAGRGIRRRERPGAGRRRRRAPGRAAGGRPDRRRAGVRRRRRLSRPSTRSWRTRSRPPGPSSASSRRARRRTAGTSPGGTGSSAACRSASSIVEASDHSGSLITARCALEQGRSVMAVPGAVLSGRNRGAHALLRDGAPHGRRSRRRRRGAPGRLAHGVRADVAGVGPGRRPTTGGQAAGAGGTPRATRSCGPMRPGETYGLEDLAALTGLEPVPLLARLARLEVGGWVRARRRRAIREGRGERAKVAGQSAIREIHGETVGDRRVAGQGEDAGALPGRRSTGSRPATATSATCPSRPSEVPAEIRKKPWGRLGVDIDGDFTPYYVVPADKKKQVQALKAALKDASELLLATDPDREGESISWHLREILKPKVPVRRIVFHEITEEADQGSARRRARPRREPRQGAGEPPHPRPALRLHAVAGALEEGADRAERRARAERRRAADRRARGGAPGVPLERATGTSRRGSPASGREFAATLVRVGDERVATGKDFDSATGALASRERAPARRSRGAQRWPTALIAAPAVDGDVGRGEARRRAAGAAVHDVHAARRKPAASSGSRPSGRCRSRSGCSRAWRSAAARSKASSPTTAPTRRRSARRRSASRRASSARCSATSTTRARAGTRRSVKNAQEAHEAIRPTDFRLRAEGPRAACSTPTSCASTS